MICNLGKREKCMFNRLWDKEHRCMVHYLIRSERCPYNKN